jgi:glyceraldehyde-3-phosphate dehydrogenase (NADP+)
MNLCQKNFRLSLTESRYLFSGWKLKEMGSETSAVFSTIFFQENAPTILGSIPFMGEAEGEEAVNAASMTYNNADRVYVAP